MSTRARVYRPVVSDLPSDFGERIEEFRVASGLTVRSLARMLGVSPHRVREWRRGVAPSSGHLYLLLMIAGRMGLRELLERPGDDLPAEVERQIAAARGGDECPSPRYGPLSRGLGKANPLRTPNARKRHRVASAARPSRRTLSPR